MKFEQIHPRDRRRRPHVGLGGTLREWIPATPKRGFGIARADLENLDVDAPPVDDRAPLLIFVGENHKQRRLLIRCRDLERDAKRRRRNERQDHNGDHRAGAGRESRQSRRPPHVLLPLPRPECTK